MKSINPILLSCAGLLAVALSLVTAAPGDVDPGFNLDVRANYGETHSWIQPDGKTLFSGVFTSIEGGAGISARINANGTLDTSFTNTLNNYAWALLVLDDGKLIVGGTFTAVDGVARHRIARLNPIGTLDAGFNSPNANDWVSTMVLQSDGKVVIGGVFTSLGATLRGGIARLNTDGTVDADFHPNADNGNGYVYTVVPQPDGKLLVGGWFSVIAGATRNFLARLNADGSLDTTFDPNPNGQIYAMALQADGKIIMGGTFTTVGGVTRNKIARLNADGTLDAAFDPNANDWVSSIVLQTDGKMLIGGRDITSIGGGTRNYLARLNADGTLDTGFNPNPNNPVFGLSLRADGKIWIGGGFTSVGGVGRTNIALLANDPATQSLTVSSTSRVEWRRGGASPEVGAAKFELSTDGGTSWSPLGAGTRITGGWELTGLNLPAGGKVRGRARTPSGSGSGSSGLLESVVSFGSPEIAVEQPADTDLTDGNATINFGTARVGDATGARTFTVKNTGGADLNLGAITKAGGHTADFTLNTSGMLASVPPGGQTTFSATFTPGGAGSRGTTLQIANDDNDENPFDIMLAGTGAAPEIAVEHPVSTDLTDGSATIAYGAGAVGFANPAETITIRNSGTADLAAIIVTKDGANIGDFTVDTTGMNSTVAPDNSTTFTVTFTPGAAGSRAATIRIASNDADENPFDLNLTGQGLSFSQDSDGDGLNDASEFQMATLGFNYQVAQPALVSVLFASANGAGLFTAAQVQALNVGPPLLLRNPATNSFTLTVGVQKATNLTNFVTFPMTSPQVIINDQGKLEFQFSSPDNAAFFRLQAQ